MDERKASILRAVVESYIETAQPVGSAHVAQASDVAVSSATVRNEMAALERDGYLTQPHTSAGRIPTDKGYRFFVDQLTPPGTLEPVQTQQVRRFFARAHGELEQMLADTARLLTGLTDYAAVVVRPAAEGAVVRSVQLVGLAPRVAIVVAVLANGVIEKRTVELAEDVGDERLGAAGSHLAGSLIGRTLRDVAPPGPTGDARTDAIARQVFDALVQFGPDEEIEHVFVGGASRMAAAFDAVETVRSVLSILEQQYVVVGLLRDVLDRGLSVAIGTEHGVQPLAECSVVVAPYEIEGDDRGTIGLLGPTRMNYPQALAAVAVVSQRLGRHLTEG